MQLRTVLADPVTYGLCYDTRGRTGFFIRVLLYNYNGCYFRILKRDVLPYMASPVWWVSSITTSSPTSGRRCHGCALEHLFTISPLAGKRKPVRIIFLCNCNCYNLEIQIKILDCSSIVFLCNYYFFVIRNTKGLY